MLQYVIMQYGTGSLLLVWFWAFLSMYLVIERVCDYVWPVWSADSSAFGHRWGELQKAASERRRRFCVVFVDALFRSLLTEN